MPAVGESVGYIYKSGRSETYAMFRTLDGDHYYEPSPGLRIRLCVDTRHAVPPIDVLIPGQGVWKYVPHGHLRCPLRR